MQVDRVNESDDGNRFEIRVKGSDPKAPPLFICEREYLTTLPAGAPFRRGHWLMMMFTLVGWLEVDRDQYSNDLLERAGIHAETGTRYGGKFKIECSKAACLKNVCDWQEDLAFQFGGEFAADYHEWDSKAVLTKRVGV